MEHGSLKHVLEKVRHDQVQRPHRFLGGRVTAAILSVLLIASSLMFVNLGPVSGATFTFVQTDWAGGTDGGVYPVHPGNQTGWNKYESKDAGVTAGGGNLALTLNNSSNTQTTDAHFNGGTKTNVNVANNDLTLGVASTANNWAQSNVTEPSSRYGMKGFYDVASDRIYMFGGIPSAYSNETYTFDVANSVYTLLRPGGTSAATRIRFAYAYDTTNRKFYITGGATDGSFNDQTWMYDVVANTWTNMNVASGCAQYDCKMVYDPINAKLYLVGISTTVRAYTIASNTWATISPTGSVPSMSSPNAVWDTQNNRMIVHNSTNLYTYTPSTNTWASITPTGSVPSANEGDAVWDTVNNRMLIYGCASGCNTLYGYTPSTNTIATISATGSPTTRGLYTAAFDSTRGKFYVYGGTGGGGATDELFDVATSAWSSITANTTAPSGRYGAATAFDPAGGKFYLFGGRLSSGTNVNDLWSYNISTNTWTQVSPTGTGPSIRHRAAGVWDPVNSKFYVFGGINSSTFYDDLYSYTPGTNTWAQASPTGGPPAGRYIDSAIWDSTNNKMWVFGGDTAAAGEGSNDLWSYTPATNTWAQASPTGGPPGIRSGHTVAWDGSDKIYVFGGVNTTVRLNDLWTYTVSTNTWAQLSPPSPPSARNLMHSVWNTAVSKLYVFGGFDGSSYQNATWVYDPSANTWTQLSLVGSLPTGRYLHASAWDSVNNRMIIFGGEVSGSYTTDTHYLHTKVIYQSSGDLISSAVDTGQSSNYGNLTWNGSVPTNTVLRFQLRSATTSGGLSSATWLGPTGSGDYYTSSGTAINSAHSGHRWIQYRAYLSTTDTTRTSTLNDITVNFSFYPSSATLTSSPYDTSDANNALARIEWTENLPANTDLKFQVRTAPSSASSNFIYALRGGGTSNFYRYSLSGDSWSSLASTLSNVSSGGALVYPGTGDFLYSIIGTGLGRYSISGDSWATMAAPPTGPGGGATLVSTGNDFLYYHPGSANGTAFYRYSISGNSWSTMASTPSSIDNNGSGAIVYPGTGDYIYAFGGGSSSNVFIRYSISGNSWSTMAVLPANHGGGDALVATGGDYIYALRGATTTDFYRYSISGNSWTSMASIPSAVMYGGSLTYTRDDYIYATRGDNTTNFYRYSISGNSWSSMAATPATIAYGGSIVFPSAWTSWMGPDGTSSTYFTDPAGGETMPSILTTGNNDQWVQYKAFFESTNNLATPTLSDLTLSYSGNGPPSVTNATATQGSNGVLTVGYDLADVDSATHTVAVAASFGVTLNGAITNSATSLTVSSATSLPSTGSIFIDSEEILYGSKSGNTLNSLTRARNNSNAASHSDGASIFFKAATVSGNVGSGISTGTAKSVTWTLATDLTSISTSTGQIKIFANDGNLANQQGSGTVSNVTLDTLAASTGSASSVQVSATSSTAVTVTWTTNESSNSFVDYGTTTAYGTTASNSALSTSHSVSITSLTANTTYYFRIRSTDAFNNTLTDDNGGASFTFTTPASDAGASRPVDETPPVITNIQVTNIATNVATVSWTTDEESSSIVNYGLTNTYGSLAGVPDIFVTGHTVALTGLIPGTVYNYQVVSLDRNSNRTASANASFTTATGTGSGTGDGTGSGTSSDVLEEQVNELLNENTALNTQINELNAKLGSAISEDEKRGILRDLENLRNEIDNNIRKISELSKFREENESLRAEVAKLRQEMSDFTNKILGLKDGEGLSAGDLLKLASRKFNELARAFKLQATVEERAQIEEDLTDTTSTLKELTELVPPPRVLTRPAIEVTSASATVSWTTDKPTFGSVLYGDDASFRADRSYVSQSNDTNGLGISHTIVLSGLAPATTYHYQIAAKSEAGAETNSADFTFTTKTASPIISNGRTARTSDTSILVSWATTLPSNSVVTYTPYVNGVPSDTESQSEGKPELVTSHVVNVTDLKPATTYDIEISSTDAFGNTVTDRLGRIVTSEDKIVPIISQVRTEISVIPGSQNRVQVIISWRTDEPATTQVFYSPGAATGANADQLKQTSNLSSELTFNHIAVITNWEPGTIYRFRTISKDESGNESQSKTFTVLTPRQKATVVDLIIDNFSDIFGWTKGIK